MIDLFYFLDLRVDADLQCTTWPKSLHFGCSKGGTWISLSKTTFGTEECESLCLQYASREGCCFVGDKYGCYWKSGATVYINPLYKASNDGLAVACTNSSRSKFF